MSATKAARAIALCCAACVGTLALAQEPDEGRAEPQLETPAIDDQVIVRGQNFGVLRSEIQRAEEVVFARFNDINSDDDFDIHCGMRAVTGSRVPRRFCAANFWHEEDANIALQVVLMAQGSAYGGHIAEFQGRQRYKFGLLRDEIRRVAAEDEEMQTALTRLANLNQTLAQELGSSATTSASVWRQVPADEEGLPYGADSVIEVRIGLDPWRRVLTRRTFTLAHVYGEIRSVEVECDGKTRRLEHEVGVEWTIPASWGSCMLLVDASRDTMFALYEFE